MTAHAMVVAEEITDRETTAMHPSTHTASAEIHWVDVFATRPLTGNPLAVILCEAPWDDARMQAMAAELGLSETVFAQRAPEPAIRIFTPTTEIPMAGHPLVGAAWVLHHQAWIADRAVLRAPGGDVAVAIRGSDAFVVPPAPRHIADVDADELAAALGTTGTGTTPVWHAGLPQAMLAVDDPHALRPDHDALMALGIRDGWAGVSAYRVVDSSPGRITAEVRHFAAPIGIPEDPVTGSAAGALGAVLACAGHGENGLLNLDVRQGHSMGRPGEVRVIVGVTDGAPVTLEVGGTVVPIMSGVIGSTIAAG